MSCFVAMGRSKIVEDALSRLLRFFFGDQSFVQEILDLVQPLLRGASLDVLDDAGLISPQSSCACSPALLISALTVLVKSEHPSFLRIILPYTDSLSLG